MIFDFFKPKLNALELFAKSYHAYLYVSVDFSKKVILKVEESSCGLCKLQNYKYAVLQYITDVDAIKNTIT